MSEGEEHKGRHPRAGKWLRRHYKILGVVVTVCVVISVTWWFWWENSLPKHGHLPRTILCYKAVTIPVIDGIETPGEWNDTAHYVYTWTAQEQKLVNGTFRVELAFKYNATKLFVLMIYNDYEEHHIVQNGILIYLLFDNLNDDKYNYQTDDDVSFWVGVEERGFLTPAFGTLGWPEPHPEEPVNYTIDPVKGHIVEIQFNLTRFIPKDSKVGFGFELHAGNNDSYVAVPDNPLDPSTYPDFVFIDSTYGTPSRTEAQTITSCKIHEFSQRYSPVLRPSIHSTAEL